MSVKTSESSSTWNVRVRLADSVTVYPVSAASADEAQEGIEDELAEREVFGVVIRVDAAE